MKPSRLLFLAPLQIAQALVGFGAIAAFTRLMSADTFGRYALVLSASMLAHTLVFTWVEAAAFRYFAAARAEGRLREHFATLALLAAGLGGAVLGLALLLLALCGISDNAGAIAAFAAASAVFRFISKLSRESERAALRLGSYAVKESAYLLLGFAAGIALLVTTPLGAAAPFAGALVGGVVICITDAAGMQRNFRGGAPTSGRAASYAKYGAPLALALALDLGVQTLIRLLVAHQSGEASLGAYAAAFGLTRPLDLMFISLSGAFAPIIYAAYEEQGAEAARDAARTAFRTLAAIVLPSTIGLALVAGPLSAVLVGPALQAQAATILPWMAVAAAASGFNVYYWSEAFQLTHKTGLRALLMLAPAAVQIACTLLLSHTAIAAAQSAAIGAVSGTLVLALAGRRALALPVDWRALGKIAVSIAVMAAAVRAASITNDIAGLATGVLVGVIAYAASAFAFDLLGIRSKASAVSQALWRKLGVRFHASFTDRLDASRSN